ncbi:MAG: 50S ribosomal protein L15 [bacterium]
MRLYGLQKPKGSTKTRKRVGRGCGSGTGKTSGKGHKGQKARSGAKRRAWNEGGQMPLVRRVPKRGFRSLNLVKFQVINLDDLARKFEAGGIVTHQDLRDQGLVKSMNRPVKILGEGELKVGLNLTVHGASKSAREKVSAAGGKVEIIKW